MKISVLGPKGTFTDLAAQLYIKNQEHVIIYQKSINDTFMGMSDADLGIVPLENTLEGFIQPTLDGLLHHSFFIIDEIYLPVSFDLIGNVDSRFEIKKIYTQFATKNQCTKILSSFNDQDIVLTESNSTSFNLILKNIPGEAAIVPSHLVEDSHRFLIRNVTDSMHNYTRFAVISKTKHIMNHDYQKVSLVVIPTQDRPGLLYDILGIFKSYEINLSSIVSRPEKTVMGKYVFFIDLETNHGFMPKIEEALSYLHVHFNIKVLGIYPNRQK